MSKINAVRLININYNHNAIRISDETFQFQGKSTLVSLRNGGGKSVLVQMMTAPFVHKRYRDAKDRPFESYFTTSKPSFILTEWALDQGAGYVLAGMMVRRSQETQEETAEELEMINFISEYRTSCQQDIHHLPVVEKGKREILLKNFAACRQMFEGYKKDPSMTFFYYDMASQAQSRQYFEKLSEYQINYKEWEGIIKKVNRKESGLSELFADCRDEKGLVEKWFLDAVENKLNKEKNRMKEFQSILEKYVGQYKDNQSKIQRRDDIRLFQEEAVNIEKKAQEFRESEIRVEKQENRIACFRAELEALRTKTAKEEQENQALAEAVLQDLLRLEYEKLSEEYYLLEEEKNYHAKNRDMIGMEKEGLEREIEEITRKLHLLACAKQQETVSQDKLEWSKASHRLSAAKARSEDLEPERNRLGGLLHACCQQAWEETQKNLVKNRETARGKQEEMKREQEALAGLEEALRQNALRQGELKSAILGYDKQEEKFNSRYQENLTRNILGEYEPGSLEIFAEGCRKALEETIRSRTLLRRDLEEAKEQKTVLEHALLERKEEKIHILARREQQQEIEKDYEQELKQRRAVLTYLELGEDALFQEERIMQAADHKLLEIEGFRRILEKEENELLKEYQRLTEGRVLELPPELEAELEGMGIHIVYGMEWLRKNGYSPKENQKIVKSHPFLPYSLILTEGEAKRLSLSGGSIPTAFPIPIILRKDLEQGMEQAQGNMLCFPKISFYLLFNENLLDEKKLRCLVEEKQSQIQKKRELAEVRKKEYAEYFSWKEQVRNQKVREGLYQKNKKELKELAKREQTLDQEIRAAAAEISSLQERGAALERQIRQTEREVEHLQHKKADVAELFQSYEEYRENCRQREKSRKEEARLEERSKLSQQKLEHLREKLQSLQNKEISLERLQEKQAEKLAMYQGYEKAPQKETDSAPEFTELEAKYAAITAKVSQELVELEQQEQSSGRRYQKAQEELARLSGKYQLTPKDWKDVVYSVREEEDQESRRKSRREKMQAKESMWNQEDKQIALFQQQMEERLKRMAQQCQKERPMPRKEIRQKDFASRKNQLDYQGKELQKAGKKLRERLHSYDENLTALAEYSEIEAFEPVVWKENFSVMDAGTLRNFKGILIRDYNKFCSDKGRAGNALAAILNQILRMERFQEDFYRKPLEAMLELSGDARQVQQQLDTTVQSYQSLMEKLEVDISLVEKEKDRIAELLLEYLQEVHANMGKIDQNSTITVQERPVKMLKIQIPSWEENEGIYQIRLQDFMDEMTQKGVAIFQKNENPQEYFGVQMTTRNLYDRVVGIGNVQVRLYKVEEQRGYPITWAEVARNSGGEGFLSAFVVLSSLLYYMRRDDSDIFADRNQGKVLLMDNPFAQTNASHLLKPLMDMAKKTNTQLICFSGLGGESIYSRFDNIYVLNLVAAGLRQGMQYLKGEHLRGEEAETILPSRIQVMEQQELLF